MHSIIVTELTSLTSLIFNKQGLVNREQIFMFLLRSSLDQHVTLSLPHGLTNEGQTQKQMGKIPVRMDGVCLPCAMLVAGRMGGRQEERTEKILLLVTSGY